MLNPGCRSALQLCKHEFVFTPVYAKDAPTRLPWAELLSGLIKRAVGGVRVAHRVWVVALVWLIFVPWITCLAWRLAFVRSLDDVSRLLRERWNVLAIATDCIQVRCPGQVGSVCVGPRVLHFSLALQPSSPFTMPRNASWLHLCEPLQAWVTPVQRFELLAAGLHMREKYAHFLGSPSPSHQADRNRGGC